MARGAPLCDILLWLLSRQQGRARLHLPRVYEDFTLIRLDPPLFYHLLLLASRDSYLNLIYNLSPPTLHQHLCLSQKTWSPPTSAPLRLWNQRFRKGSSDIL